MAAPSIRQHVRIKLSFQSVSLEPRWLFIEFSKFKTIGDIHNVISSRYFSEQPCKLKLFLHDCVLPETENCLILENNDAIIVDCQELYKDTNAADHSNMKRTRRTTRDASPEEITSYEEGKASEHIGKRKKKKKKRGKTPVDLSIQEEAMQLDDPIHLRDKNKSLQKLLTGDENVMMTEDLSSPAEVLSNKRSRNRDDREPKQLGKKHCRNESESSSSLKVAFVPENMEGVTEPCSTTGLDIEDSVEMINASADKVSVDKVSVDKVSVDKVSVDKVFVDKVSEVPVDVIEHKGKRRVRKRKRKTQSPSTSRTTPTYRNPEQCVSRAQTNIGNQNKRKHQGDGKHVHFGSDDSVNEPSEKDEGTTAHAIPAPSVCHDSAMLESNFAYGKQDISSEAMSPGGSQEARLKGDDRGAKDDYTSQPSYVERYGVGISPHVNGNAYNNDKLSPNNSNSGIYIMSSDSLSGPTVINELFSSKQSSPVVFTRPRQKKYRAFSKEDQLNTSSSNRSIIFQNPAVDDRATPTKPIEVTAIPVTVDYQRFPVLQGFPRAGDKIAYKDLVLNDTYEPVLSDFKEAVVVGFDAISKNVDLEIKRQTETPRKYGKFDVVLEDDAGSLTNIPNEAEKMQIYWGSIKDVRLIT